MHRVSYNLQKSSPQENPKFKALRGKVNFFCDGHGKIASSRKNNNRKKGELSPSLADGRISSDCPMAQSGCSTTVEKFPRVFPRLGSISSLT
jgi:hypothetical protein